jgi:hypothetical protein
MMRASKSLKDSPENVDGAGCHVINRLHNCLRLIQVVISQ